MIKYGGNEINNDTMVQDNNTLQKCLLIGLGGLCGLAGGIAWGYSRGKKKGAREASKALEKHYKDKILQVKREAMIAGFEDAQAQAQAWINEHVLMVEGDTTEEVAANMTAIMEAKEKEQEAAKKSEEKEEVKSEESSEGPRNEEIKDEVVEKKELPPMKESARRRLLAEVNDQARMETIEAVREMYAKGVSCIEISQGLGIPEATVRHFAKNVPDEVGPDGIVEVDEDIDNYDLAIDEDEVMAEEAKEMTEARERYLDEVDRYIGDPENGPRYISQEEFSEEVYLDKVYVDYFDVDKVFVSNDNSARPMEDPTTDFGTNDGDELFAKAPDREDEDIVNIKNFKMNAVFEITRYHQAYGSILDGSAFVNGSSADGRGGQR